MKKDKNVKDQNAKDQKVKDNAKKGAVKSEHRVKLGPDLNFACTEAYNLLRTNLSFALVEHEGGKIVGVTSSNPQEGKSFTSINLAYSLAQAGNKVILIDADMRRPSIAKTLKKSQSPGLSNYLLGETTGVIHENVLSENLSVVMAGDIPPNPSQLIGSSRMEKTLQMFASRFDYVIVDLPPVNSVADPLIASQFIDGMIVMIRHMTSSRGDVMEAIRQLQFANVNILGFVYNGYSRGGSSYSKRSYYRGYYKGYYRRNNYYYYNSYYRDYSSHDAKKSPQKQIPLEPPQEGTSVKNG